MTGISLSEDQWLITEEDYQVERISSFETIFTLANGYVGVRGSVDCGSHPGEPATFFAGVFDACLINIDELANGPNWIELEIVAGGETIDFRKGVVLGYRRSLDMKQGILVQALRWQSPAGRITRLETRRLVHLEHKHTALVSGTLVPENYSGTISVASGIDGYTFNPSSNPQVKLKHLQLMARGDREDDGVYLEVKTFTSGVSIGVAAAWAADVESVRDVSYGNDKIEETRSFEVKEGQAYGFEKFIAFFTSRETGDVKAEVLKELDTRRKQGADQVTREHVSAWAERWGTADILISGDDRAQKALRFNIFHLIQSANANDDRVSIAAKGLHGPGYKGHVFWDTELYVLPFFIYTDPSAARALLRYRYHTLDGCRENARSRGYRGVQFPLQSSDTGREVTPRVIANHITGETWDISFYSDEEHHTTADVAFAIDHYIQATGDTEFLLDYGAEMMLGTARFWASRSEMDAEKARYVIRKVMGPDEDHQHVDNNVYTNVLARWNIEKALEYVDLLKENHPKVWKKLRMKMALDGDELKAWQDVAKKMFILYDEQTGLYEQFEGYFKLRDPVITDHDEHGNRIRPQNTDNTQLIKQADVVMLQYLLSDQFSRESKKVNYQYYEPRTMHTSSLSDSSHAIVANEIGDYDKAYSHFIKSVEVDLVNLKGNAGLGIHSASQGGSWQAVTNGFAGIRLQKGMLFFDPRLPDKWKELQFKLMWHGEVLCVAVTKDAIELALKADDESTSVDVVIGQEACTIRGGNVHRVVL